MIVKVPVELIGDPANIGFVVMTSKPGAGTYGASQACDVAPGGRLAMEGSLITRVNEYNIVPKPGATRTTPRLHSNGARGRLLTGEGFVYDNAGNVICDLDKSGNIVRKYVYGPSTSLGINKHLAMQIPSTTQPWTYENNVLYGGWLNDPANVVVPVVSDPAALVDGLAFKCTKGVVPGWNCVVWGPHTPDQSAGGMYKVTFRLKISDNSIASPVLWLNGFYHYGTAGEYVILSETQVNGTQFTAANQYQEFEVMMNIPAGITNMEYRVWTHDMCDIWVDRITVQNMNATTYYYHCDYLGSPRVMTDAAGAVTWRQDYYAFGSDYPSTSLGNSYKFTGHIQDAATGQYYAKARYFTTQLGRWSQPEPLLKGVPPLLALVMPKYLNPYVYCINNPLRYFDPNGLWTYATDQRFTVTGDGLTQHITNIEDQVDVVFQDVANRDAVVTCTTLGNHTAVNSRHYTGNAIDLRTNDITAAQRQTATTSLATALGNDYDVVDEGNHIHLEYDPPAQPAQQQQQPQPQQPQPQPQPPQPQPQPAPQPQPPQQNQPLPEHRPRPLP